MLYILTRTLDGKGIKSLPKYEGYMLYEKVYGFLGHPVLMQTMIFLFEKYYSDIFYLT